MDTNNMRQRIADELNRRSSDIIGGPSLSVGYVVNREINSAIQHYESTRMKFNEIREEQFGTTSIGVRTTILPPLILKMDSLKLVDSSAFIRLRKRTFDWIEEKDRSVTSNNGTPLHYAIYGNVLRFWPIPDQAYTLYGSYIKRFLPSSLSGSYCAVLTFGGHSLTVTTTASHNNRLNGWFTDAEQLIRHRASAAVKINYFGDENAKQEQVLLAQAGSPHISGLERNAFERQMDQVRDLGGTGRIKKHRI